MSFIHSDCHRGSGDICTWINCQHHCTLTTRWQLRYTKNVVVHIFSRRRPKFVRISFSVMWFKDLEYQGYIYHYENGSAWIFKIMDSSLTGKQMKHFFFFKKKNCLFQQLLESELLRLWLWLLLLKITAWHLLNQSVSVLHTQFPSTWKLSPTLAFCNVLSLKQNLPCVLINKSLTAQQIKIKCFRLGKITFLWLPLQKNSH